MNSLLRQAKETRRGDTVKSKSPTNRRRSKSGGKNKLEPKSASRELKHKSEKRLSLRIGDTLKRLDFIEMLHGEDENIVYPSASTRHPPNGSLSSLS